MRAQRFGKKPRDRMAKHGRRIPKVYAIETPSAYRRFVGVAMVGIVRVRARRAGRKLPGFEVGVVGNKPLATNKKEVPKPCRSSENREPDVFLINIGIVREGLALNWVSDPSRLAARVVSRSTSRSALRGRRLAKAVPTAIPREARSSFSCLQSSCLQSRCVRRFVARSLVPQRVRDTETRA